MTLFCEKNAYFHQIHTYVISCPIRSWNLEKTFITQVTAVVAIAVKEMTPLRPRAIEVSAPIWTREQNQLLRSSTDGAHLQVFYSQKKISPDTGYSFLKDISKRNESPEAQCDRSVTYYLDTWAESATPIIDRWRPFTGYIYSQKKISSDTGFFLENIGRWRSCTGYSFSEDIFYPNLIM